MVRDIVIDRRKPSFHRYSIGGEEGFLFASVFARLPQIKNIQNVSSGVKLR